MNVSTQQKDTSVQPSFHFSIFLAGFLGEWKRNKKEWKAKLRNQQNNSLLTRVGKYTTR